MAPRIIPIFSANRSWSWGLRTASAHAATATRVDLGNASSHLTDTIHYWTHATVPTLNRFAPFGDQSRNSNPELFDYHRRLMLEARANTTDTRAKEIASWWLNNISVRQMSSAFNYRHDLLPAGTGGVPPTDLTYHATGTGHLFSRTGWDTGAMWVAFTAGPYVESHAHQDQGAIGGSPQIANHLENQLFEFACHGLHVRYLS